MEGQDYAGFLTIDQPVQTIKMVEEIVSAKRFF
jgi:hypothetical protein